MSTWEPLVDDDPRSWIGDRDPLTEPEFECGEFLDGIMRVIAPDGAEAERVGATCTRPAGHEGMHDGEWAHPLAWEGQPQKVTWVTGASTDGNPSGGHIRFKA